MFRSTNHKYCDNCIPQYVCHSISPVHASHALLYCRWNFCVIKSSCFINPWRACAARVTVLGLCVCACVCYSTSHFSRDYSCHKRYKPSQRRMKVEKFKWFSLKMLYWEARAFPIGRLHKSAIFLLHRKGACVWIWCCVSSGGAPTPLAHRCSWWKFPHILIKCKVKTWWDMRMGHLWHKWVGHLQLMQME